MRVLNGIDEIVTANGETLGTSDWYEVTQDEINMFAKATGDEQWIHVDVERAKDGPFGGTIAHGYYTLSTIPRLNFMVYRFEGVNSMVNYGSNKVRYLSPVHVGKKIRGTVKILDVTMKGANAPVTTETTVEVEGSDKPACIAETLTLVLA